jgi:Putative neutral zinc metallopeptidase
MSRRALLFLAVSLTAIVIPGCGSSSRSSTHATSTTPPAVARTSGTTRRLAGTTQGVKAKVADLKRLVGVRRSGPRAHLLGVANLSPSDKLIALAQNSNSYWLTIFKLSNLQLPAASVNVVDQVPATCGSTQISSTDGPVYCAADQSIDLPLAYMQKNIQPIGDAAMALVVSDLYGYHVENAVGAFNSGAGITPANLEQIDACFSGTYFENWLAPSPNHPIHVSAGDQRAVDQLLAGQAAAPGTPAGPGVVTADQLTAAFNKGAISAHPKACLPNAGLL